MGWLIAAVVLGLFGWGLIRYSTFRKYSLLALLLVAVIGTGAWYFDDLADRRAWSVIDPKLIELIDPRLHQAFEGSNSWEMRADIVNHSEYALEAIEVWVRAEDCPDNQCATIGDERSTAYIDVPTNQKRALRTTFYFDNLPKFTKLNLAYDIRRVKADLD